MKLSNADLWVKQHWKPIATILAIGVAIDAVLVYLAWFKH